MMKKIKKLKIDENNKGITMIALVVTIIVLLLLAGISIQMLTGNNGVLQRAGEAKNKTGTVGLKEEIQIALMEKQIDNITGTDSKTLKERLESGISGAKVEEIIGTDGTSKYSDVYYVKRGNDYVTVYEDGDIEEGKVEIWDGKKILCPKFKEEKGVWNWYIYTPSQLKFLADFVNNGNKLDGRDDLKELVEDADYDISTVTMSINTTIYLMNNIDLGARQTDGQLTVGTSWMPIGTDYNNIKDKMGTFEGNNYTIRGVYVKTNTNFNGIFGISNTIQRLTIKNSYIEGAAYSGGIVGHLASGKIEKCHNKNTIIKTGSFGGGIAGFSFGTISYCTNNGYIEINGSEDATGGGIVGSAWANSESAKIKECINNGIVKGKGSRIGGIIGQLQYGFSVIDCNNNGFIEGKSDYVGGIIGTTNGNRIVTNCSNNGAVTGMKSVGGIAGMINFGDRFSDCKNNGIITGTQDVGGIYGTRVTNTVITNCINKGKVNIANE